jgi:hypothetical protein
MPRFIFVCDVFACGGPATCNPPGCLTHETQSQEQGGPGHIDLWRRKKKIQQLSNCVNLFRFSCSAETYENKIESLRRTTVPTSKKNLWVTL